MEIREIDYIIINYCEYVNRIKDYLDNIAGKNKLDDILKYKYDSVTDKACIKNGIQNIKNYALAPIFLYDNVFGNGMYIFDHDYDEIIRNISEIMINNNINISNVVCFKCNRLDAAFKTLDFIKNLEPNVLKNLILSKIIYVPNEKLKLLYLKYEKE